MKTLRLSKARLTAVHAFFATLAACGGGSDSPSTPTTPTTMSGTVATGAALANAAVTVIDSAGKTATATSNGQGVYSASISGMVAPFVLVATDPTGQHTPLVSVLQALPSGSAPAVVNVTTLTTAIAALLTPDGNALTLIGAGQTSTVTSAGVTRAVGTLDAALATILAANQVSANFNPLSTAFTANRIGADAVIDAVELMPTDNATLLVPTANPSQSLALNSSTATSPAPLPVPPAAANYLDYIQSALQTCLAPAPASRSASACNVGFDTNFLDNGHTSLKSEYSQLVAADSQGATISPIETVGFYQSNGTQYAEVVIPYTFTDGTSGSILTTAQKLAQPITLADGSTQQWDIVGNQLKYNIQIQTQVSRITFEPSSVSGVGHYDAGLLVYVPAAGVNPTSLNSVNVKGPGLPGAGLWLVPRNSQGNTAFAIPPTQPTAAPTTVTSTPNNTDLFLWSWQALVAGQAYTPRSSGAVAQQQVTASSIPLDSAYAVTLYDTKGAQIDQVSVTNWAAPADSAVAARLQWSNLAGTTATDVLTTSGSMAGAQATLPVSWTQVVPNNGGSSVGMPVTSVEIQSGPDSSGTSASPVVDGFLIDIPASGAVGGVFTQTVTAGVDQNGVQTCTSSCSFLPLFPGNYRDIELQGHSNLMHFYDVYETID